MKKNSAYIFVIVVCTFLFFSCGKKVTERGTKLFNDSFVHEVRITLLQNDGWDSLVYYKNLRDSIEITHYIQCNIVIDSSAIYAVGLRFKGESSYDYSKSRKKSFKLSINEFNRKQDYDGIEKINLNNNFKDPSMMREKIMIDFFHEQNLPAPRASYARVYLNNEYFGLYLLAEEIDKEFLERNFKSSTGNLYIGEPDARLISFGDSLDKYKRKYRKKNNLEKNDWIDLIAFIKTLNDKKTEDEYVQYIDALLNSDNCLKAWAINNLFVNIDAYNIYYPHNYYLYNNPDTKKFEWVSYDFNFGFAAWNPKFVLDEIHNFDILYVKNPPAKNPLTQKLLKDNKHFQKIYLEKMQELTEKYFSSENLFGKIDKISTLIRKHVYADSLKAYTNEQFEKSIEEDLGDVKDIGAFTPGLKPFIIARRQSVLNQLKNLNKGSL